jgi:hypothetical protein
MLIDTDKKTPQKQKTPKPKESKNKKPTKTSNRTLLPLSKGLGKTKPSRHNEFRQ